jgi:hypothetical protein
MQKASLQGLLFLPDVQRGTVPEVPQGQNLSSFSAIVFHLSGSDS